MKSAKRLQVETNVEQRKAAMAKADGGINIPKKHIWEETFNEEYKKPPTKKQLEDNPALQYESGFGSNYPLRLSEHHDKWLEFFEKKDKRSRQKMIDYIIDEYINERIPQLIKEIDDEDELISM